MEIERRTVLAAAAAATIVGVGSGCAPERARPTPRSGPGTIKKADVPVGGGVVLPEANFVVTQPKAGEYKAFVKMCPHAGCGVSRVDGEGILCPCHGSRFDIATGQPKNGPAQAPLSPANVRVDGDSLVVSG